MPWQLSRRCQQHNVHHARTNEVGIDEDIATDPALFLWAPDPKNDAPWRKYQGAYLPLPMSMLFLVSCFHPRLSSCCFPIFLSSGNTGAARATRAVLLGVCLPGVRVPEAIL